MQQEFLFEYNHSKDKPAHALVTIALIVTASLVISIITYLIAEAFFSQPVSMIVGVFIFVAFILFLGMDALRHRLKRLTVSNQEICWETSQRQQYSIKKGEVFAVNWQNNKLLFNQQTKLDTSSLSFKYKIFLNDALSKLFPENILELEGLEFSQFYQTKFKNLPNSKIKEPPFSFEAGRQSRLWLYVIGAIFSALLIVSTLWIFIIDFQGDIYFLRLLGIFGLIAYVMSWYLSTYRAICISDEGILCQKANNSQIFKWHEIEAIEIHINYYRGDLIWKILIWKNDKYISISFRKSSRMSAEKINELNKAIIIKARINDIPFGVDGSL